MATDSAEKHIPQSEIALLLIDFINPLDFAGAENLAADALEAAKSTAALKKSLQKNGVPAIYANDNYGRWQSDFNSFVSHLGSLRGVSAEIARLLRPQTHDLTILKPRHSAFYGSPLSLLLQKMGARQLIITGLATDICVQFTAMDAFLRGYQVHIPSDCTASESHDLKLQALGYMKRVLECDVAPSAFIRVLSPPGKRRKATVRPGAK